MTRRGFVTATLALVGLGGCVRRKAAAEPPEPPTTPPRPRLKPTPEPQAPRWIYFYDTHEWKRAVPLKAIRPDGWVTWHVE